jgi:hypothetical protein
MEKRKPDWDAIEELIEEVAELQKKTMLTCAKRIVPNVIQDDLLQPNDFPLLENNPLFRYEEGVLAGIKTVAMALQAMNKS